MQSTTIRNSSFATTLTSVATTVSPSGFGLSMVFGAAMAVAGVRK